MPARRCDAGLRPAGPARRRPGDEASEVAEPNEVAREDGAVVCLECGAAPPGGQTCQDLFHRLLERKYAPDAAEYGLAMACYTLQHAARQADTALEWARFQLTMAVEGGLPLAEVRRAARARFDRRRRLAQPPVRHALQGVRWRMTIAQLEGQSGRSDAESILAWARCILEDILAAAAKRPE
jgi:hypothetical protein